MKFVVEIKSEEELEEALFLGRTNSKVFLKELVSLKFLGYNLIRNCSKSKGCLFLVFEKILD